MPRIVMFNFMSLDGMYAGPGDDVDWHRTDEEFEAFSIGQLREAGGLLFGRRTYELMAGYWPGAKDDPETARDECSAQGGRVDDTARPVVAEHAAARQTRTSHDR